MCFTAFSATDELESRSDVSPLVASANLKRHGIAAIELTIVISLKQHVREFSVRDSRFESLLHRLLRHHVVDGEVLADIAHKVDRSELCEPVSIVPHLCFVFAGEIEELLELLS